MMKGGKAKYRARKIEPYSVQSKRPGFANIMRLPLDMPKTPRFPGSAFLYFVVVFKKEFQKQFRANNPPNTPMHSHLISAAQVEWDTMSDDDKAPYTEEAEKSMKEFEKNFEEYNKQMNAYARKKAAARIAARREQTQQSEEARRALAGLTI